MNIPENLRYSKDHEWARLEGDVVVEGITDYAQQELADIIYVNLPQVGRQVKQGEAIGSIDAVKTVADIYAIVSGTVIEVNNELKEHPDFVNKEPYGKGWMIKIKPSNPSELNSLLDTEGYKKLFVG